MWREGSSIQEIAAKRELSTQTVENHLFKCAEEGYEIDWHTILTTKQQELVNEAVELVGDDKLKPIKEAVPEEVTYFMIKVALFLRRMNKEERLRHK